VRELSVAVRPAEFLGLSTYHWVVIAAAWMGWGFDLFDALLFNFVAPNCIPALVHQARGSAGAHAATAFWTGAITSILLVGWALGGAIFGWVADRIGRKRALFATITIYAAGTALCALATDIWQLVAFRSIASIGIGGEWGIGAALVAEGVPENRRVEAGTIVATAGPIGVMLAAAVNYQVAGVWFAGDPETSWRYVFLAGLAPVILAFAVRSFLRESERWTASATSGPRPSPLELFGAKTRASTLSGLLPAVAALLTWWGCGAFMPLLGGALATEHASHTGMAPAAAALLAEAWKTRASNAFNFGGLLGIFAAAPLARQFGRRPMFIAYFVFSALMLAATFGPALAPQTRLAMLFPVGLGVAGILGAFAFYLPELFETRLRGLASGFCFNIGRVFAAAGPLVVGTIASHAGGSSAVIIRALFWLAAIPLTAAVLARFVIIETRGRTLPE
jgi:MFS family permease